VTVAADRKQPALRRRTRGRQSAGRISITALSVLAQQCSSQRQERDTDAGEGNLFSEGRGKQEKDSGGKHQKGAAPGIAGACHEDS
jgi:hypothetical protein